MDVNIIEEHLAPFAMRSCNSRGRKYSEDEHPFRSAFQRDRDRVIHCTAFRRLEYKTQVFVNSEGDHFRTRLTHTLEVAQIGRTIARALGVNEDLTEAIALAHDLGHTPFGHSGEEALDLLMSAHGGFEHNAQGLRVVDFLERRYSEFPGLNLNNDVRESFAKHSTRHDFPLTHNDFDSTEQATLEAQIIVLADEIAYDNHDLDDGLASGILRWEDVSQLKIWQVIDDELGDDVWKMDPHIRRAYVIRRIINLLVTDVIEQTRNNISEFSITDIGMVRKCQQPLVSNSIDVVTMKEEMENFLNDRFYKYYTVVRMMNKAQSFLSELFNAYLMDKRMLPDEHQAHICDSGLERTVCDYIAGMTDRFAQQEYHKLFSPFERPSI
jgi:dGTPase